MLKVLSAALVAMTLLVGCKERNMPTMESVHQYKDEMASLIPGAQSVEARVERNNNTEERELTLIICAPGFMTASGTAKYDAAIKAGAAALTVFGEDVDEGKLIITAISGEHRETPKDAIEADMKLDSLRSAAGTK